MASTPLPPSSTPSSALYPFVSPLDTECPKFSLAQVAQHAAMDDCWVVIHGNVYDVTNYLHKHPGGISLVLKTAGGDTTAAFEAMYHSTRARQVLEKHKIGELDEKSKSILAGSHLNPYASGASRMAPGAAKGTGPYGLGAYNPRDPLSRLGGNASMPQRPAIDQLAWRRYELISIVKVNHNTSIFRFQVPHKAKLEVGMGKHLSVSTSINNKTTKREYTPITDEPGYFELLVKHYENGPLSSYIHTLKVGDGALMRGLFGNLDIKPNKWKTLYMFAAGTGIAPMIPFIKYFSMICQKEAQDAKIVSAGEETSTEKKKPISYPKVATRMHLLFANKTEDDILLGTELEKHAAACNGLLTIDYLLSQAETVPETSNPSLAYKVGRISDSTMKSIYNMTQDAFTECEMETGPLESTFSLICGPDGFVASVKVLLETVWHFPESYYHAF